MISSSFILKKSTSSFEDSYIELRRAEGRLLTDDELSKLPYISPRKEYQKEWMVRARSANKLYKYLEGLNSSLNILEVGCGNGWLANYLSKLKESTVTGIDPNGLELKQANRVFKRPNLEFRKGEFPGIIADERFDIVVFAASIQYFSSLTKVLQQALNILNRNGEIHIIDTHFYKDEEVTVARERSRIYFNKIGFPEMIESYHHHRTNELNEFDVINHYSTVSRISKLFNRSIFPWYSIVKK